MKARQLPNSEWQRIWFAIRQQAWSSLAIVPSHSMDVVKIAESLTETGRLQAERPVSLIDATGVELVNVQQVVATLAGLAEKGESAIVAVDPIAENPTAVAIIQAASAAVLVVRLGESLLAPAQQTIDLVGRSRFIGSIVIDGASNPSFR